VDTCRAGRRRRHRRRRRRRYGAATTSVEALGVARTAGPQQPVASGLRQRHEPVRGLAENRAASRCAARCRWRPADARRVGRQLPPCDPRPVRVSGWWAAPALTAPAAVSGVRPRRAVWAVAVSGPWAAPAWHGRLLW